VETVKQRIKMHILRLRKLSLEKIAKATFTFMLLLAVFSTLYSILVYKENPPMAFLQFIQIVILIMQTAIFFIQTVILARQLDLYRRHEIPIIVLRHYPVATINAKNLTDNPAFYIKLEVNPKSGKRIDDEIIKNIRCNIVEYLGPREERGMCHIVDLYKFAEVVDIVKISYLDAYGDWHEMVFSVEGKDKLIFTPMPQNIFKQERKEMVMI